MIPTETKEFPGAPSELEKPDVREKIPEAIMDQIFSDVFQVSYRKGNNILAVHFYFPNRDSSPDKEHLRKAIVRAKKYCTIMRFCFLFCNRFITDLAESEARMEDTE